jgi:L-ascorbate metabolism protein UlaG (beta-lactamase superfamily)
VPDPTRIIPPTEPALDHVRADGRFLNPHGPRDKTVAELRRWRRERQKSPWPKHVADPPYPPPGRAAADELAVTFIGHSTFLVQIGGLALLTDPIWSDRCSPVSFAGPKRARKPGQSLDVLPPIDLLLVSHNHYDHMDLPTLRQLRRRWNPSTVTGLGNARHLAKAGIKDAIELDWWHAVDVAGARVTYVPAQHFSARTPYDRNRSLWGGFVVQAGGASVYFAGDSGYCPHFQEIGARFPALDLALLPIGAYEPRWFMRQQHVDPEEAVRAHRDLAPKRAIGMHFGTFQLTDEPIDAPVHALAKARHAAGLSVADFDVLGFGETRVFPIG